MTARLPTPTMSATITQPAPRVQKSRSDSPKKRSRPERKSITLDAGIVEQYTSLAGTARRPRFQMMNEALLRAMPERRISTAALPAVRSGVLGVVVLDQTLLFDVDGGESCEQIAKRIAKAIHGARAKLGGAK